ncbi:MAG: NmrA family NAD(P)-binding protein [Candidatus Diapherotrites archaeon]|nr:NmrA family NAD(P)-binding protein [Candidatus Diapherotrites archaeon]
MRIALFGATGKTGMNIVRQALEMGHEVKAFV